MDFKKNCPIDEHFLEIKRLLSANPFIYETDEGYYCIGEGYYNECTEVQKYAYNEFKKALDTNDEENIKYAFLDVIRQCCRTKRNDKDGEKLKAFLTRIEADPEKKCRIEEQYRQFVYMHYEFSDR